VEDSQFNSCCKGAIMGKIQKKNVVGYGAIIDHFGSTNPYKKDDAQQLKRLVICCQNLHAHLER
jgi:hypothetical protein